MLSAGIDTVNRRCVSFPQTYWVGMRTFSAKHSGTDSPIVLTVNDNGTEQLHHTFSDTPQRDQETGEANLYDVV